MPNPALDDGDVGAMLDLVEALTTAETLNDYVRLAMMGIKELITCIDVSYNEMNVSLGRIRWTAEPENPKMDEYAPLFARLMRQNPLVRHFEETADTRALMWSDFVSTKQLEQTELWQEMFRPLGVSAQMAMVVPTPPGIVVGFAVNTGTEGFSERDRAVFNTLRPHLAHLYSSIQLRDTAKKDSVWTGALANRHGIVESVTDNASELGNEAGIELTGGEPLPDELRQPFLNGINGYRPSQPAARSSSTRLSDEADGVAGWHVPGPVGPHVVVVQTRVDAMAARLVEAGLTERQADVALQLAQGGTNAAIARRLGIAEGTLRKHLEHIYRALDVTDRASAIARIRGW